MIEMLSKEKFCELMDKFERQYRHYDKWSSELYKALGSADRFYENDFLDMAIQIMDAAMECKEGWDGYTAISWWIFEDDFGNKEFEYSVGKLKDFVPKTSADLYEIIVEENKSNE